MGRLDGRVALISGAARGQGRSHAVTFAKEGADVIIFDICKQMPGVEIPMATPDDLQETAEGVRALGRRVVVAEADVRDTAAVREIVDRGLAELGHIDIVMPNAGIVTLGSAESISDEMWDDMIAVNLSGVYKTVRAALPSMIERGKGGSIVLTSSTAAFRPYQHHTHYTAAKHGVTGIMRSLAYELAPHRIRVNAVAPCAVNTPLVVNDVMSKLFAGGREDATPEEIRQAFVGLNLIDEPWVEPVDVSKAALFLASDDARFITGITVPIDLGLLTK